MGKFIDLMGKRFGKLLVVGISPRKDKFGQIYWICDCDCNERCTVRGTSLRNGHTTSCGCAATGLDETGKVYGLLTVIDRAEKTHSSIHWNCECLCKKNVVVRADQLRSGKITSCGCDSAPKGAKRYIDEVGKVYGNLRVLLINEEKGRDAGLYFDCECSCGSMKTVRGVLLRKGLVISCGCDASINCADEVGRRYGEWLVIGLSKKKGRDGSVYLDCRCVCGTEKSVLATRLRRGFSKSCGCGRDRKGSKTFRDLTGMRFGKLLVIGRNSEKRDGKTWWDCICDCGTETPARSDKLLGGFGLSCGCGVTPDETGKTYGKLTVISPSQLKGGEIHWPCKCDCGEIALKRGVDLRSGHVRACSKGCLASDRFFETGVNELIRRTKQSATGRGLEYSLSRNDVERIVIAKCDYCDRPPSNELKTYRTKKLKFKYSGIDRIDSSKGYIPGNIAPCCDDCNTAKGTKTLRDHFEWVKGSYSHMCLRFPKIANGTP